MPPGRPPLGPAGKAVMTIGDAAESFWTVTGRCADWLARLPPERLRSARLLVEATVLHAGLHALAAAPAGPDTPALRARVRLAHQALRSAAALAPDGALRRAALALADGSAAPLATGRCDSAALAAITRDYRLLHEALRPGVAGLPPFPG
jgi:hypothetical protein